MAIPSIETERFWIYADRETGNYPRQTKNSGKWLIFVSVEMIDSLWEKIKKATQKGLLGETSKVSTAKKKPNVTDINTRVICVFTYDYTDKKDVFRIREGLRQIGITQKIPYKTDQLTKAKKHTTKNNIDEYYD